MADVAWSKQTGVGNSDIYEVSLNATDKTTPILQLDPRRDCTIGVKTTGSATADIILYLEHPENVSPVSFTYAAGVATIDGADYVKSALGPLAGIDIAGTVTGGDTVIVQVITSIRI